MIIKTTILLSVLVLGCAQTVYNPEPELECKIDNSFKVTVNGVGTGFVCIEGCNTQPITAIGQVFTFDGSICNPLPVFDETFEIVIKEFELLDTANKAVFNATCSMADNDTLTIAFVSNITLPDAGGNGVLEGTAFPEFAVGVFDGSNNALTEGVIGDPVKITIRLRDPFSDVYSYKVSRITVCANGLSVVVVEYGCSLYPSIIPDPPVVTDPAFAITIQFDLFSIASDGAPNPTTVTYKVELLICNKADPNCPPLPSCQGSVRKRRQLAVDSDVTYPLPVVVYSNAADMPPKSNPNDNDRNTQDKSSVVEDCESHMPYIWGIIALAVVSLLCVLVMTWLVCRTRENLRDKSYAGSEYHSNSGYKH